MFSLTCVVLLSHVIYLIQITNCNILSCFEDHFLQGFRVENNYKFKLIFLVTVDCNCQIDI